MQKEIEIKGARVHNLKNISVKIPHRKMTVITGLSGSGKSSLAFDTLFAEGQRRYVESLSSYARQFLGKLEKPDVDYIKGISPAIAIEQRVISSNPRSTVGTVSEVYDYIKLLYARIGKTYSPISGKEVKKHQVSDVVDEILKHENKKIYLLAPLNIKSKSENKKVIQLLKNQGFTRLFIQQKVFDLDDETISDISLKTAELLLDRFHFKTLEMTVEEKEMLQSRLNDSVFLAFAEGDGECKLFLPDEDNYFSFSNRFELDGMTFVETNEHFFTFNSPFGACPTCEGFGSVIGIDPKLVIPDETLSVYDQAVSIWKTNSYKHYYKDFIKKASAIKFHIHRPYNQLSEEEKNILWYGSIENSILGIYDCFENLEKNTYNISNRILFSRYRGKTECKECKGTRLRKETSYVKINETSINQLLKINLAQCLSFFQSLQLNEFEIQIGKRLLPEINQRLENLCKLGLSYLNLNRPANTLSGGESQRINLAKSLSGSLVGSMYILDEPSIGLHPRDTQKLLEVLKGLRDVGNTVIIVEHEEEVMREADYIIDMGPKAGAFGGEVVFEGNHQKLIEEGNSLTAQYLNGTRKISFKANNTFSKDKIIVKNAHENNLQYINVEIPLYQMVCVTGVSGSGKSSLIKKIVFPALEQYLSNHYSTSNEINKVIEGDLKRIRFVEFVDQNAIGKSSRSNPATYLKIFDEIRELFAQQNLSKHRGYRPGFFSYNVEGGRCDNCEGEGEIVIGMQFMADVRLLCEECKGKRYKEETLEVKYEEKSISDILEMTIEECYSFFITKSGRLEEKIVEKIKPLIEVGLSYLKMGQSSSTLSGGEAQRVKLAFYLSKNSDNNGVIFFDEPTTGLHFYDIEILLSAFQKLIEAGNSIVIIEHNLDVIRASDWVIDLGPEGGDEGGKVVFAGKPEDLIHCKNSYTGQYLKKRIDEQVQNNTRVK
ncbi:MAG: excinuclease ABC subunit UvrA [Flavobacteriia bacterium]|nr:excinuclease ABC subunit UvrA [Flavobacteriia bacterium]